MSEDQLLDLYQDLPENIWTSDRPQPYWTRISHAATRFAANRTVLDVGCYRGDFLAWLPDNWTKLGVEPSERAAAFAMGRGIRIVGSSIERLGRLEPEPGCIISLDVIEHIVHPVPFLSRIRDLLKDGGCVVIMTGNTSAWTYRLLGRHYWYCALPEHVSFFCPAWFQWAARQLEMTVEHCERLSSQPHEPKKWWKQATQVGMHALAGAARRSKLSRGVVRAVPYGRLALTWTWAPWWNQSRDHLLVVLRKSAISGPTNR